jgi:zinc transporter ZupT
VLDEGRLEPQVTTAGECELHSFGSGVQHRQVHSSSHQHQQHQHQLPLSNQRLHTLDGSTQQGHSAARLHRVSSPRGQGHSATRLHTLDGGHSVARLHQVLDLDGELQPLNREGSSTSMLAPLAGTPSHAQQPDCHSAHVKVFLAERPLSFATTVLLAGALCVHSILEGMALGAQQSMKDTEDIMIAIAAHKGLAAYALGASIVESKASASKFWTVVRGRGRLQHGAGSLDGAGSALRRVLLPPGRPPAWLGRPGAERAAVAHRCCPPPPPLRWASSPAPRPWASSWATPSPRCPAARAPPP